ncbi:hypothetical protein E2I00_010728, partial [Balaenoptera physalus]
VRHRQACCPPLGTERPRPGQPHASFPQRGADPHLGLAAWQQCCLQRLGPAEKRLRAALPATSRSQLGHVSQRDLVGGVLAFAPVPVQVSRGALMVRVGGGWVALDEYLVENDPERGGGAEPMGQGLVIPSRHTGNLLGTETPSLPRSRQGSHSVMKAASEDSLARQPQDRAAAQAAGPEAVSKAWTTKDTGQEGHLGRGQRLHQRPHGPPRAIK